METIYHVGNEDDWLVPDDIIKIKVLKPTYHPKVSPPKANRKSSQEEKKKALRHYSSNGGHNRSTCKYIVPTPSTISGSGSRATK